LYTPFVPFIVIFCNTVETADTGDLSRLQSFVASLEPARSASQVVERFHGLFSVLYNIARRIVDMRATDTATRVQASHVLKQLGQGSSRTTHAQSSNAWSLPTAEPMNLEGQDWTAEWLQDCQGMLDTLNPDDLFFGAGMMPDIL